jgi:superfamily II DNA/RNA helicase
MNYHEIIQKYVAGEISNIDALSILDHQQSINKEKNRAFKLNYYRTCIHRYEQYKEQKISAIELMVFLRDFILILGKLQVNEEIVTLVQEKGHSIGLFTEQNNHINVRLNLPSWFTEESYVKDVYGGFDSPTYSSKSSPGDLVLQRHTRFKLYRSLEQKLAVHTAISLEEGNTLLLGLSTGAGKSLITQVLASISNGLTVVIVPTVALAIDQYRVAKENLKDEAKIKSTFCYRGNMPNAEVNCILNEIESHTAVLLITSPEALLKNKKLQNAIYNAAQNHYLKNIIIDEAHIVPDWGIFFRPEFQLFSIFLRKIRGESNNTIRTFLLSATVSNNDVETLRLLYGEKNRFYEFRCDSLRQEPRFVFRSCKTKDEQLEYVSNLVYSMPKPMIVYVLKPDSAKEIRRYLGDKGFKNIPIFTGETTDALRNTILENWNQGEYDIIIATSAFGLGVDKSDVRTIVHACMPESLSRFYQEVGRAGRDGNPSLSISIPLLCQSKPNDSANAFGLVNKRVLKVETMLTRWRSLCKSNRTLIDGDIITFDLSTPPDSFTDDQIEYSGNKNILWNVNLLLFMHRNEQIDIVDVIYDGHKNTYYLKIKVKDYTLINNPNVLMHILPAIREKELVNTLQGYYLMEKLYKKPESLCWASQFKRIFPLVEEHCNGCPKHKEKTAVPVNSFNLRRNLKYPRINKVDLLREKIIGSYNKLMIIREEKTHIDEDFINSVGKILGELSVDTLVVPPELASKIVFEGIILTYDEFIKTYEMIKPLFNTGVAVVFSDHQNENDVLYNALEKIENQGFATFLICKESMYVSKYRKTISNIFSGYRKSISEIGGAYFV